MHVHLAHDIKNFTPEMGKGEFLQERRLLLHQNLVLTLYQLCFHAAFHSLTWLSALYSWELELKRLAIRLREISTID